jgi:hypothetical protein
MRGVGGVGGVRSVEEEDNSGRIKGVEVGSLVEVVTVSWEKGSWTTMREWDDE